MHRSPLAWRGGKQGGDNVPPLCPLACPAGGSHVVPSWDGAYACWMVLGGGQCWTLRGSLVVGLEGACPTTFFSPFLCTPLVGDTPLLGGAAGPTFICPGC